MTTTRTRKPQTRIARLMDLGGNNPALILTVGKATMGYICEALESRIGGRAFRLEKANCGDGPGEVYNVLLNGNLSTCECMGFLRHGMCADGKGCKHIAGLNAAIAAGKLAMEVKPEEKPEEKPVEEEPIEAPVEAEPAPVEVPRRRKPRRNRVTSVQNAAASRGGFTSATTATRFDRHEPRERERQPLPSEDRA